MNFIVVFIFLPLHQILAFNEDIYLLENEKGRLTVTDICFLRIFIVIKSKHLLFNY